MCAENSSMNYHWNESDISDWFKSKIEEELIRRKYKIVSTDIYVKICARMNSIGLVYTVNIDALKNDKNCILENFNTTAVYNEGLKGFSWFMDFFKEKEAEAILKFSKNVLELGFDPKREFTGLKNITAKEKTSGDLSFNLTINCGKNEIKDFLTNGDLVRNWNCNVLVEDKLIKFENVEILYTSVEENEIKAKFKLTDWENYSEILIKLENIRNNTKITIEQSKIPLNQVNVIEPLWRERIFKPICMVFGFSIVNQ
jgi:activator of HSP90 ATPase